MCLRRTLPVAPGITSDPMGHFLSLIIVNLIIHCNHLRDYNVCMRYFEVFVADSRYHGNAPLTYSYSDKLAPGHIVTVPLRNRPVTGFVLGEVDKPDFAAKEIKAILS